MAVGFEYTIDELFAGTRPESFATPDFMANVPAHSNTFREGIGSAINNGEMLGNTTMQDGYLQSSNFVTGSAGWQLGPEDAELNISTAILSLDIPDTTTANSFHVESDGDTFWGATPSQFTSDNDNANAYVLKDGTAKFQSVTLTNSVVMDTISSGSLLSIQGWQFDGTFSASDSDTVAWTSGTLSFEDGNTFSISGSNTGNMGARTYIYFDKATSTTAFQTSTTASDAVGANKVLVAVAENTSTEAVFQAFGGKGGLNINADNIAANAITANEIAANTITATEINVSQLSAIAADMGSLTAGDITLDSSGHIKSGQSGYDSGTGFFLGIDSATPKFSIGDSTANKLTWNGSTLTIVGTVSGSIDVDSLDADIPLTKTNVAAMGWNHNIRFSATASDAISWNSGTLRFADGTTDSINSGSKTGLVNDPSYIYYDGTATIKISTTVSDAVGSNKILLGVVSKPDQGDDAEIIVFGGPANHTLISGDNVAANSIVANNISVNNLAAINADMGSITSGSVVIDSSGFLRGGATGYETGTGFWLGNDGGTYKFYVGDINDDYISWTGSKLVVNGYQQQTGGSFGGDGSDGALSITSGTTTIDLTSSRLIVKNYTSIDISGSGDLQFSNPADSGSIIVLRSQGDVTIDSSTTPAIDLRQLGAEGTRTNGGNDGSNVWANPSTLFGGGESMGGPETGGAVVYGGGGASSIRNANDGGKGPFAGQSFGTTDADPILIFGYLLVLPGGGGGDAGNDAAANGGRGGGALLIECGGSLDFQGANAINADGQVGVNTGTDEGGGGGAGTVVILYNSVTTNTGSITADGAVNTVNNQGNGGDGLRAVAKNTFR